MHQSSANQIKTDFSCFLESSSDHTIVESFIPQRNVLFLHCITLSMHPLPFLHILHYYYKVNQINNLTKDCNSKLFFCIFYILLDLFCFPQSATCILLVIRIKAVCFFCFFMYKAQVGFTVKMQVLGYKTGKCSNKCCQSLSVYMCFKERNYKKAQIFSQLVCQADTCCQLSRLFSPP